MTRSASNPTVESRYCRFRTARLWPARDRRSSPARSPRITASYRVLRDAVAELEAQPRPQPGHGRPPGRLPVPARPLSQAIETLAHGDGGALAHFYLGKAHLALDKYADAITSYAVGQEGRLQRRRRSSLAKAEAQRYAGQPQASLETLDTLSGAVEQTAEYLYQRAATVAALGGNPTEVIALLRAGRRSRRQARRRPVRPGARKRSPRQRRERPRPV